MKKRPARVRTLRDAARFVDRVGFAYVFPDNRIPLPSLWGAVSGRPTREMTEEDRGWTKAVGTAWTLKDRLGESRLAWFGRFFRGKGSLISLKMLPPLFRLVGASDLKRVKPDGRRLCERLKNIGEMSTYHLRTALQMTGRRGNARFSKTTVELYRNLLIANVGTDDTETRWPSAVIGLFSKYYPQAVRRAAKLSEAEAVRQIRSKAPDLPPRRLATLFGSGSLLD